MLLSVFSDWRYSVLVLVTAWFFITAVIWFTSWPTIVYVATLPAVSVGELLLFLLNLYGSLLTNFSPAAAFVVVAVGILSGIEMALMLYYIRRMRRILGSTRSLKFTSVSGLISGVLGIGCAACGTLVAGSVVSLLGASSLLLLLPLHGVEFGFVGIALLLLSIRASLKQLNAPLVCDTA